MSINKLLSRSTYTGFGRRLKRGSAVAATIAFIFYVCVVVPFLPHDSALLYWTETTFEAAFGVFFATILSLIVLGVVYYPNGRAKSQVNG